MKDLLRELCDTARRRGASFADARVYESDYTGITRQDGRADKLDQGSTNGLGVRVLKDQAWGFACAADFNKDSALQALDAAVAMAEASSARSEESSVAEVPAIEDRIVAEVKIDPRSVGVERKMAALRGYEEAAMGVVREKLANSILGYADRFQREIICNTFGSYIETETVRTRMSAMFVVRDGEILQRGQKVVGSPVGFDS